MEFKDLNNIIDYIDDHLAEHIALEDIAEFVYFSLPHIHRIFKEIMNYTLKEYIRKRRLSEAAIELINSDVKIIDLAIKYQYNSHESFTRAFKQYFGCTPQEYRKNKKLYGIIHKHKVKEEGENLDLLHEIETIYKQFSDNPAKFNIKRALSKYQDKVIEEVELNNYNKDSINFVAEVLFQIGNHKELERIFTSGGLYLGALWKVTKNKKLIVNKIHNQKRLYENDPNYWMRVSELKELVNDKMFLSMLAYK